MGRTPRKPKRSSPSSRPGRGRVESNQSNPIVSADAIRAAEQMALAAFGSGLKLAAAFGTAAAKTTSLALASLATGADKFSDLVKKETLASSRNHGKRQRRSRVGSRRKVVSAR